MGISASAEKPTEVLSRPQPRVDVEESTVRGSKGIKVLFLDIDGVCNCKSTFTNPGEYLVIDRYMAFLVGKIQLDTGCEVVLSSSWRNFKEGVEEVEKHVVKLYGKTPNIAADRGTEVDAWLALHPEVTRYAILDDDDDFNTGQPLFKTTWETGLTDDIAKKVTEYLNK